MACKKHLTFDYKPVSNAGGNMSGAGKAAAIKGSSAANVISYISGQSIQDPRTGDFVHHTRDDVQRVGFHNWTCDSNSDPRQALQELTDAVNAQDPRSNARQGAHFIVAMRGDPLERWNKQLAEKNDLIRRHDAERIVKEIAKEAPGAYCWALHRAPTAKHPEQWHLHIYGTRREAELANGRWTLTDRNIDLYGGWKRGANNKRVATFGGMKEMMGRIRPKIAKLMEHTAGYFETDRPIRWEHRSFQKMAQDENAARAKQGLPPLQARVPTKHEGPIATRYRRALAGVPYKMGKPVEDPAAIAPRLGEKVKEVMADNDKAASKNKLIEQANYEIQSYDSDLILVHNLILKALRERERAQKDMAEWRRRHPKGNPDPRVWKVLDRLERAPDQEMKLRGLNHITYQLAVQKLPEEVQKHLVTRFPTQIAELVPKIKGIDLEKILADRERSRGDGMALFGVPFGPPPEGLDDDE